MDADEDRSGLFNEIRAFSQRKLKKVETKVTTGSGELLTEKRGAKGVQTVKKEGIQGTGYVVDNKPDLQVGMIIPGLMISSQDVAQDKKLLETYGITHILNLAYGVENAFEDDYNYKKLEILDTPETNIRKYFDDCFEFIDEARHYGNCLVHCNAGVSRCTTICTAYLMYKDKMTFTDALNAVREARPFSKPNEGFVRQLEDYNDELYSGSATKPDANEDAFTARKKAEIEAEKAAISGASNVKKRLQTFGATLDELYRARSNSPLLQNDKPQENKNKKVVKNEQNARPPPEPKTPQKFEAKPVEQKKTQKDVEAPKKKLIINNDTTAANKYNDPKTSPKIDETPISVSAFRKNFESPKVQTPATPAPANKVNNLWNQKKAEAEQSEVKPKKKILIKQRSKEAPDEQPKRRSTKDLVTALEKVNSPTPERKTLDVTDNQQKPYSRRRTTQLVEDKDPPKALNVDTKPSRKPSKEIAKNTITAALATAVPPPPPPPQIFTSAPPPPPPAEKFTSSRTIKLNKSTPTHSPTPPPVLNNDVSHQSSRSPTFHDANNVDASKTDKPEKKKLVFGRVPPPRMSISGRTLSQATEMLTDVSKVNISSRSGSNSRSESPVSAITTTTTNTTTNKNNHNTNTKTADTISNITAPKISDNMVAKRSPILPLKKQPTIQKSSSSSSDESEDNKLVASKQKQSQLKTNNNINNLKQTKEPEIKAQKISPTQSTQPSTDNQNTSSPRRVPLGQTKDKQQSMEKSKTGLTRSSTAAILNLIKTKTRADLSTMGTVDEDDEIESLLVELEKEGIDNIDWDELGVDYGDVKDIVESAAKDSDSDSSSDDDESDDEAVHLVINRQAPKQESSTDDELDFEDDSDDASD